MSVVNGEIWNKGIYASSNKLVFNNIKRLKHDI